jgi:trehalose-6-phosphatase
VIGILESFTERTPGSFLEMKDSCLSWHYRDADPDFGMTQAKNLHQHLDQVGLHTTDTDKRHGGMEAGSSLVLYVCMCV